MVLAGKHCGRSTLPIGQDSDEDMFAGDVPQWEDSGRTGVKFSRAAVRGGSVAKPLSARASSASSRSAPPLQFSAGFLEREEGGLASSLAG